MALAYSNNGMSMRLVHLEDMYHTSYVEKFADDGTPTGEFDAVQGDLIEPASTIAADEIVFEDEPTEEQLQQAFPYYQHQRSVFDTQNRLVDLDVQVDRYLEDRYTDGKLPNLPANKVAAIKEKEELRVALNNLLAKPVESEQNNDQTGAQS